MISPRKFRSSLVYALNGLAYLYHSQNNVRIHLLITLFVIAFGFLLKISIVEWEIIILVIGIVWIIEAINTVFERLFDLQDIAINPIVKIGKDVSAASVLISAMISLIIGMLIFLPKLIAFLGNLSK